jgi:ABC-type transporter Mla subunit MlaD
VGTGLFLAAIFIFEGSRLFEGKIVAETYVSGNVEGLKTGAQVTLRGVPVGEVSRINFTWNVYRQPEPRYVYVEFIIHKDVSVVASGARLDQAIQEEVRQGLRARVKSEGLAGATILALDYVNDPADYPLPSIPWRPRNLYIPSAPSQMSEVLTSLETTMRNVKQLNFQQLATTLEADLGSAQRLLDHLDQVNLGAIGTNADVVIKQFGRVEQNVDGLVTDLRGVSARLDAFVGTTPKNQNLQEIAAHTDTLVNRLGEVVGHLDRLAANVDSASLNEALEHARRATADLEQAARQFKQYPAGAIFGRPPPPAKSVEGTGK